MRDTADATMDGGEHDVCEGELSGTLYEIISSGSDWDQRFDSEFADLEARYPGTVYAELIYLLAHLRFPSDEARSHCEALMQKATELWVPTGGVPRLGEIADWIAGCFPIAEAEALDRLMTGLAVAGLRDR